LFSTESIRDSGINNKPQEKLRSKYCLPTKPREQYVNFQENVFRSENDLKSLSLINLQSISIG
jgi:hypothetical protein